MLADWSRLVRWALILVIGFFVFARPLHAKVAWAGGDDDDDDDSASSGDDDDDGGGGDDDDGGDDDADQPPVTAGGLFTKATYPVSELQRPLTITGGMTELRVGLNINASNSRAFKDYGVGLDARHGFSDNTEGLFHFGTDLNSFGWSQGFNLQAAFEGSISYDLVDFRAGVNVTHAAGAKTRVGVPFGFPLRYAVKPQVGIVALETFMTIDFDSVPDFTPAVAIVVQPIPALAIKLHAAADVADFDFSTTDKVVIPVSVNIQYSPSNLLDFGGEFSFPNLKPPTKDAMGNDIMPAPKFYDSRALLLYVQLRV